MKISGGCADEKNLTQEQLSELLNVSCPAVSKWESGDTYPDITLLFPLARMFDVSVDELTGYSAARTEAEIERILNDYCDLRIQGKQSEADELIREVRKTYPNDYRIMERYMWAIAGDFADNDPEALNKNHDELLRICDCLLSGCTDERIRLDTMTMKAKLLHAAGDTAGALEILNSFPSWYQSAGQKTEQLFAKDTHEFRYWVKKNLYELADFTANKMVKNIWYDDAGTADEKVARAEAVGDMFAVMYQRSSDAVFAIAARAEYSELAGKLTFSDGKTEDIIRVRDKALGTVKAVADAAKQDTVLHEWIYQSYQTDNLQKWTVDWLYATEQAPLARLRENPEYAAMLNKYRQ